LAKKYFNLRENNCEKLEIESNLTLTLALGGACFVVVVVIIGTVLPSRLPLVFKCTGRFLDKSKNARS